LNEKGDEDENTFDPTGSGLNNHAGDNADNSKDGDNEEDAIVQGVLHRVLEGRESGLRLGVLGVSIVNKGLENLET